MSQSRVGLEAIAFDVPSYSLDLAELAQARGIDPLKYTRGLGQLEMAVPAAEEDSVVLAVGAGKRLLKQFNADASSIGLLIVGTETSVDQSKPVSSYVHQLLGLSPECRVYETKHACYGAMAGVQTATDWVLSGRAHGKKALVIASDIARYGIATPGEPTQGAGAVALLISSEPTLVEFETERQGYYAEQVMDFWRPNYSKEAFADGHFSIQCYLKALARSFEMFVGDRSRFMPTLDSISACLYHAPFPKMMQKAHLSLLSCARGTELEQGSPAYEQGVADFQRRVAPFLELNSRVGNIYTASLFLALFDLLEKSTSAQEGSRISLFSYGSGCTAEFMTARVLSGAGERVRTGFSSKTLLEARTRIGVQEYEELFNASGRMDRDGSFNPDRKVPEAVTRQRDVAFLGVKDHQRQYLTYSSPQAY